MMSVILNVSSLLRINDLRGKEFLTPFKIKKKLGASFFLRYTVYQEILKTIQLHKTIGKENYFLFYIRLECHLS